MNVNRKAATVVALGSAQTLAWASSYYLPAVLAAPMARDLGVAHADRVRGVLDRAPGLGRARPARRRRRSIAGAAASVLIGTNLVFAAGLLALGSARGPWGLFIAWAILGVGMGSGLYEAAFAALVRLYGTGSRNVITGITLIAGFASTVGWPLSALLESQVGWRGACFSWAALHLVLGIPLNAMIPRAAPLPPLPAASAPPPAATTRQIARAGDAARARVRGDVVHQHGDGGAPAAPAAGERRDARRRGRDRRARRSGAGRGTGARIRLAAAHPSAVLGARGRA